MLKALIKAIRRAKQKRYVAVLEKQLAELLARSAPGSQIEAKRAALMRARQRLAGLLMATILIQGCAGKSDALREVVEVAAIGADEALEHCAGKLKATEGDESQKAVEARRECLKLPNLGETQDAIDALAHELEQARYWVLTGEIR